uniref:Putative Serine threonine-protein kinase n=1 Tax=Daphnia magna TaxID=35525 RepID=A0A0P5SDB4_9CRUS
MEFYESPESTMRFSRENILGRGAFACVFGGTLNEVPVAVKRIQLHDLEDEIKSREENILKSISHENVLKIVHIEENEDFKFLVLELCEATLHDYIRRRYVGDMPPDPNALHQMASGLSHIHSLGFVHRNIKPENVLISQTGVLKIADFGFCKPFRKTNSFSMSIPRGNRMYCAPEYLQLQKFAYGERPPATSG